MFLEKGFWLSGGKGLFAHVLVLNKYVFQPGGSHSFYVLLFLLFFASSWFVYLIDIRYRQYIELLISNV